jgi:hypothetical protein
VTQLVPHFTLKRGDVVTFSYETLSRRAVPVNPEILRVRTDLTWIDVVRSFLSDNSKLELLNGMSEKR